MGAEIFRVLAAATIAVSIALALIAALRKPVRRVIGARVAYWLWLLVPAVLVAMMLPAPSQLLWARVGIMPEHIVSTIATVTAGPPNSSRGMLISVALTIWCFGVGAAFLGTFVRQRLFARRLGPLARDVDGLYRADVQVPLAVGVWHSKIVVPFDFETRYCLQERELILAHERAHAARFDVLVNAIASFALCLNWFNPLLYRAVAWLQMDQELACDALVLMHRHEARRQYADALLKTQLVAESAWRLSVDCRWQSIHPLMERIAMLKRPTPTRARLLVGLAFITGVIGVVSYVAWATEAATADGPRILIDLKIRITNSQTHNLNDMATEYLVHSGGTIPDVRNDGSPLGKSDQFVACTPYLPDVPGRSTDWSALKARGIPKPTGGQILLDCRIYREGEISLRPSVIVKDGSPAVLETTEANTNYRIEVTATSSPQKIAAAVRRSGHQGGDR